MGLGRGNGKCKGQEMRAGMACLEGCKQDNLGTPLIHPLNDSTNVHYREPGIVLGMGDTAVNNTDETNIFRELTF